MFEPLVEVGKWLYSLVPNELRFWDGFRLNFILVHYMYLLGMSILGSIIIYGGGLIAYIDALFFGTGSATQSGLNTINVNEMWLYQQITFFMIANVTNPIFINTIVVFVRLWWFEKRFAQIVNNIREQRRSKAKTISRTKSEMREDNDPHRLELGVNGRQIKVLHETLQPNGMSGRSADLKEHEEKFREKLGLPTKAQSVDPTPEGSNSSSEEDRDDTTLQQEDVHHDNQDGDPQSPAPDTPHNHLGLNPRIHRDIAFADEVQSPDDPQQAGQLEHVREHHNGHIQFVERQQRNAREGSTLHIPGPRDFERGEVPQETNHLDEHALHRPQTRNTLAPIRSETEREGANTEGDEKLNYDDHTGRGNIRFDEQEHPGRRRQDSTLERETSASETSRFGLERVKSGFSNALHRRRTNTNNNLNLSQVKPSIARTLSSLTTIRTKDKQMTDPMPYLSWQATTGRNSAFLGLTEEQREELGGIEYRALKMLARVLIVYFIGFHLCGMVILLPWIKLTNPWRSVVLSYSQDPGWWAVFTSASMFNDLGFTLTPNSMIPFKTSALNMLLGTFLIIIGNTGFPVMLRFVIWIASKCAPRGSTAWEELRFLLDHPRRCFTLLFPSKATWWLFWILVLLNGVDLVFFIILDLNDPVVTSLPGGYRFLDGLFQAASTRTAGFACVNLADLHPAIQVSYLIMMYISVFPIAISVRRTNVYEEKSLGVWGGEEDVDGETDPSYVGQHLRRQLSFDLWYIFLGLFIIAIVEGDRIANDKDTSFTMFSVLFEIVSAYGTVGLSLGYPGIDASFSTEFKPLSKLVICAMMIRGRHRGLPYALDRAILLPSEKLQEKESQDANRRARRGSIFAEGHEAERRRSGPNWSSAELDDNGLPKLHTTDIQSSATFPRVRTEGSPERQRAVRRMASGMSTTSTKSANPTTTRQRRRSLSRVIAGGLSAGPSVSKHD